MLGPYRDPGPSPDLLVPDAPCCGLHKWQRAIPPGYAKALSMAATTLLLVASASLAAITYTVVATQLRDAAPKECVPLEGSLTGAHGRVIVRPSRTILN